MNFHTKCPKGWVYSGDVNIEYGGTFYSKADIDNEDSAVYFVTCQGVEGCDNQYTIETGLVSISRNVDPRLVAVDMGISSEDITRLHIVEWFHGYHGGETGNLEVVQLGKNPDEYATSPQKPDVILAHNTKIENYLTREYLK